MPGGRAGATRSNQPSLPGSSPDAMPYPRSVRVTQAAGGQDNLIESNALGELDAEYELRLNN